MKKLWSGFDRVLRIQPDDSGDYRLRCRSIAAVAIILSLITLCISIAGLIFEEPSPKRLIGPTFILVNMSCIFLIRLTRRLTLPAIMAITGLILAASVYIVATGGLGGYATPIIMAVPLTMWLMFGIRHAQIASLASVVFIWLLYGLGFEGEQNLLAGAFIHTFVIGAVTLIIMAFAAFNHQLRNEVIEARDEAMRSARTKTEFLANMSHEIRTPLNGVMGMAQLLGKADLAPQEREYADIIHSSSFALLTIVSDILDFSKIEAGKLSIDPHPASINKILDDVCALMRPAAEKKGLAFHARQSGDGPDRLVVDAARLRQVLLNITANAIKFTEQGQVALMVSIRPDGEQALVTFQIVDTGIGVAEDRREAIFDQFSQADNSTTRKFGGTGLGLSISKSLTEAMGGEISLMSEESVGSAFKVSLRLPIAVAEDNVEVFQLAS